jgi:polyphosphate glucokinase
MKPGILAIDIGGTGLKATVLNDRGHMLVDRVRVPTPHPCPPDTLLACLKEMTAALPAYDRISVGFPGVVRDGRVITAPNLDTSLWRGFDLAGAISKLHGNKPVHMLNDADMQGLALVSGHGLEFVMTLGTGVGTALFRDGELMPHMELAHHPVHKDKTYDEYLGEAARKAAGRKRWNRRVQRAIALVDMLFNPDRIYIGGGNSARIDFKLDKHVSIGSNDAGLEGGAAVWKTASPASRKTAKPAARKTARR